MYHIHAPVFFTLYLALIFLLSVVPVSGVIYWKTTFMNKILIIGGYIAAWLYVILGKAAENFFIRITQLTQEERRKRPRL